MGYRGPMPSTRQGIIRSARHPLSPRSRPGDRKCLFVARLISAAIRASAINGRDAAFTFHAHNGTLILTKHQKYEADKDTHMSRVIAVANQKGGVGKTTTTVNVAASLAGKNCQVLIVDLDPQGNATSGLGIDKYNVPTTYEVLTGAVGLADAVQETPIEGLYILPANQNLAAAEIELVGMEHREFRLQQALKASTHDFILIDCPPALGLLTINALTAGTDVLIPVQTEYYALEGLGQLLGTVQRVRETTNPRLDLLGVVLTMYDKRTSLSEQVRNEIKQHFGNKLFSSVIPRNVRLAEAPSFGRTIFEHDRWSKGARSYKQLAKEVSKRTGEG